MERKRRMLSLLVGMLTSATFCSSNLQVRAQGATPITAEVSQLLAGDEYSISNRAEFDRFRELVNGGNMQQDAKIGLLTDLDLTEEREYTPVGSLSNKFCGEFYGRDHTINLAVARFSAPERSETVSSLELFAGLYENFGVFGVAENAMIMGLKTTGSIEANCRGLLFSCLGAIVGQVTNCILNCSNECSIAAEGVWCVGGIVGLAFGDAPALCRCCNKGNISVNNGVNCGGIVAGLSDARMVACCNTGNIDFTGGTQSIWQGRLVGGLGIGSGNIVIGCYNVGNITVSNVDSVNGVFVDEGGNRVENCYSTNYAEACEERSEQEMKTPEFVEELNAILRVLLGIEAYRYVEGEFPEIVEL